MARPLGPWASAARPTARNRERLTASFTETQTGIPKGMPVLLERALVSGAGGFVGSALVAHLAVTEAPLRMGAPDWTEQLGTTNFEDATIFHLAARVHGDDDDDPGFLHDNVDKTLALARAARRGGARRFVFLSSVKVNGEESRSHAFNRADKPAPQDAYARSKAQAEAGLAMIEGLDVVVVRSPLVYGPGVKGNLLALLRLCDSPWPLPFGALDNRRSFVHVDDLARLLIDCATHPDAAGRTYFAAHERGVSTRDLVAGTRGALGRPARLVAVPARALEACAAFTGQRERMQRLTRSLEVDASDAARELGWTAQIAFENALEDMVGSYRRLPS
jgi:nucleoside-diphosphate-sugar epimerase